MNMNESTEQVNIQKKPSCGKYIIAAGILFFLAGYIYAVFVWKSEPQKASEKIIREAIAKMLNKDPNKLANSDLKKITKLSLQGEKIKDIKFLRKFINLKELNLIDIRVPETKVTKWKIFLRELNLDFSDRTSSIDISPLEKLHNLQKLKFDNVDIKDIKPLRRLTNLQDLYIQFTMINDLESLRKLKKLQKLYIYEGNSLTNLKPLNELKNLQELYLRCAVNVSLEPIKDLTNLEILCIDLTDMGDFEMLKNLMNLRELTVYGRIQNLEMIRYLKNLQKLWLISFDYSFDLQNIEPLKELTNLQDLYIGGNVSDIEPLKGLANLLELYLNGTQVSDLESLKELTNLRILKIMNCHNITDKQVDDLQKALPNLEIIR